MCVCVCVCVRVHAVIIVYQMYTAGECIRCFGGCGLEGCAGPLPYVNSSAGCKSCNSIIIDRQGEQVCMLK